MPAPAKNLNLHDPSVEKIMAFVRHIKKKFPYAPKLGITIRVLETLAFIKLNAAWIEYAVNNKTTDNSIYTHYDDKGKQVLRSHNDMSFHVLGYATGAAAVRDYATIIASIENGIDLVTGDDKNTEGLIDSVDDSPIGCMEARVVFALSFIQGLMDKPKLETLFRDCWTDQEKLRDSKYDQLDDLTYFKHIVTFFHKQVGKTALYDGKEFELKWNDITKYSRDICGYDYKDLLPEDPDQNPVDIHYSAGKVVLIFQEQAMAERYLTWIQLSLPNKLYEKLKTNITQQDNGASFQIKLTEEQFAPVAERIEATTKAVFIQALPGKEIDLVLSLRNKPASLRKMAPLLLLDALNKARGDDSFWYLKRASLLKSLVKLFADQAYQEQFVIRYNQSLIDAVTESYPNVLPLILASCLKEEDSEAILFNNDKPSDLLIRYLACLETEPTEVMELLELIDTGTNIGLRIQWLVLKQLANTAPEVFNAALLDDEDQKTILDALKWRMNQPHPEPFETIFNEPTPPKSYFCGLYQPVSISLNQYINTKLLNDPSDATKLLKVFSICTALDSEDEPALIKALNIPRNDNVPTTNSLHLYQHAQRALQAADERAQDKSQMPFAKRIIEILDSIILNITIRTDNRPSSKLTMLENIRQWIKNNQTNDCLNPSESQDKLLEIIQQVCSMKRNRIHFWKTPEGATELKRLLVGHELPQAIPLTHDEKDLLLSLDGNNATDVLFNDLLNSAHNHHGNII